LGSFRTGIRRFGFAAIFARPARRSGVPDLPDIG
jgi:hypothetical protein